MQISFIYLLCRVLTCMLSCVCTRKKTRNPPKRRAQPMEKRKFVAAPMTEQNTLINSKEEDLHEYSPKDKPKTA